MIARITEILKNFKLYMDKTHDSKLMIITKRMEIKSVACKPANRENGNTGNLPSSTGDKK